MRQEEEMALTQDRERALSRRLDTVKNRLRTVGVALNQPLAEPRARLHRLDQVDQVGVPKRRRLDLASSNNACRLCGALRPAQWPQDRAGVELRTWCPER